MSILLRPKLRWLRSGVLGLGLGFIAGGFEAIEIASTMRLDLAFTEALSLSLVAVAFGGAAGLAIGLGVGIPLQLISSGWRTSRIWSTAMAATAFFLSGFYLWHAAMILLASGRPPAALAMAACPIGVAGVVWFNAGYWGRKEELGVEYRFGWRGWSAALAFGLALIAAASGSSRTSGSSRALDGDPNVLLITIDTLRRDHVSVYGEGFAETPRIDAMAAEDDSVVYWNAVTPTPETAPAHASIMTALHPLRHEVISNGHSLSRGRVTLAERLQDEGYATGAFLSSFAVNHRTGLDQGFDIYEDDFVPGVRGFSSVLGARYLLAFVMRLGDPHDFPWLLERFGSETNKIASAWIRDQGEKPWFAWVHYFEPHAPYEGPDAGVDHRVFLSEIDPTYTEAEAEELRRLYAYEVGVSDALVGDLLDLIDELGQRDRTMVIVTSDHGEQLGEHDIYFHHHNLYDESMQVPLVIRAPGARVRQPVIKQQVRLMDIAPTVLDWIKLDPFENRVEGAELLGYAEGVRKLSLYTTLFGRKTASLSEGTLFGLRTSAETAPREGEAGEETPEETEELHVKYMLNPATGEEELYNLNEDPDELVNLVDLQPETAASCRELVEREIASSQELVSIEVVQSDEEIDRLRALGYVE